MFTGLIEQVGVIAEVVRGETIRLAVAPARPFDELSPGDSLAVSGPCLTVEEVRGGRCYVSLLPETARGTTLGSARAGQRVNLERSLRLGDRLGGHLVGGHVDGVAEVLAVRQRGDSRTLDLRAPGELERYLVDRGSVALDGVSLTVREPEGARFSVALVAETLRATTLGDLRPGARVNIEADLLAKHVEKLLGPDEGERKSDKLLAWLAEAEPRR